MFTSDAQVGTVLKRMLRRANKRTLHSSYPLILMDQAPGTSRRRSAAGLSRGGRTPY